MIVDASHRKLRFGAKEWFAVAALFLGPTGTFGTWVWKVSERVLLLESTIAQQTDILKRLDNNREQVAVNNQRLRDIERRIGHLDGQRNDKQPDE